MRSAPAIETTAAERCPPATGFARGLHRPPGTGSLAAALRSAGQPAEPRDDGPPVTPRAGPPPTRRTRRAVLRW
jgi:hypothetical protein